MYFFFLFFPTGDFSDRGTWRSRKDEKHASEDIKSKGYFCNCAEETCYFTEKEMREKRKKG